MQRAFMAQVDDTGSDLDPMRASADGRQEREWRTQQVREVMNAQECAVEADVLGGLRQLNCLQVSVGSCACP